MYVCMYLRGFGMIWKSASPRKGSNCNPHAEYCGWKKYLHRLIRGLSNYFLGFQPSKVVQDFFNPQYEQNCSLMSFT